MKLFGLSLNHRFKILQNIELGSSNISVEGHRSNPVLAVKRSLLLEIRFLRYMHWASNATFDRPVVCQMKKLEQIKA